MKTFYQSIFTIFSLVSGVSTFGQLQNSANAFNYNDSLGCNEDVFVSYAVGNVLATTTVTTTIAWGDGSTTNNVQGVAAGLSIQFPMSYSYAIAGTYPALVSITDGVTTQTIPLSIISVAGYCGYLYNEIGIDNNGDGNPDTFAPINVDVLFTGADGTITSIATSGGPISGLNVNNAPYTMAIDPAWLATSGYNLVSTIPSNSTITGFSPNGQAIPATFLTVLACNPLASASPDLSIPFAVSFANVAPLQTGRVSINICNNNCSTLTGGVLTIAHDANVQFVIPSGSGATDIGGVFTIPVSSLTGCIYATYDLILLGATPAGTVLNYTASLSFTGTDPTPANNTLVFTGIVQNSYDPNNKISNQAPIINPTTAQKIGYRVNFQNDGNFPAVNIVVRDTISPLFNLSSFRLLGSSHTVSANVNTVSRIITFTFSNINLVPSSSSLVASQGFVDFEIIENNGNGIGTKLKNKALIYFDFNPAIVTNTAINENNVANASITDNVTSTFGMYPNPTNSEISIATEGFVSAKIFTTNGQVVKTSETSNINVSDLADGIYFVQVQTKVGFATQKLTVKK